MGLRNLHLQTNLGLFECKWYMDPILTNAVLKPISISCIAGPQYKFVGFISIVQGCPELRKESSSCA